MKNVRMLLLGAIVTVIVGSALAFKQSSNLFACVGTDCIAAAASSISGTSTLNANNYYTTDAATTHLDCTKPGTTTGCSRDNHPGQAFAND